MCVLTAKEPRLPFVELFLCIIEESLIIRIHGQCADRYGREWRTKMERGGCRWRATSSSDRYNTVRSTAPSAVEAEDWWRIEGNLSRYRTRAPVARFLEQISRHAGATASLSSPFGPPFPTPQDVLTPPPSPARPLVSFAASTHTAELVWMHRTTEDARTTPCRPASRQIPPSPPSRRPRPRPPICTLTSPWLALPTLRAATPRSMPEAGRWV